MEETKPEELIDKLTGAIRCLQAAKINLNNTGYDIMQNKIKEMITHLEDECAYIMGG